MDVPFEQFCGRRLVWAALPTRTGPTCTRQGGLHESHWMRFRSYSSSLSLLVLRCVESGRARASDAVFSHSGRRQSPERPRHAEMKEVALCVRMFVAVLERTYHISVPCVGCPICGLCVFRICHPPGPIKFVRSPRPLGGRGKERRRELSRALCRSVVAPTCAACVVGVREVVARGERCITFARRLTYAVHAI